MHRLVILVGVGLLLAITPVVAAQELGIGDSGPAVGDFAETDDECGFSNFTDDSYEATLGIDDRGRFVELVQTSTGDAGIFRLDESGNMVFETEGDEVYDEFEVDGDVLRSRYVYTSNGCSQTWLATVTFPPGFLNFLYANVTADEAPAVAAEQSEATTSTTTSTQPAATPPPSDSDTASEPARFEESGATGGEGLPVWVWWLLVLMLLVFLWFSAQAVGGGRRGTAPGDNGDDPRDTSPPAVFGEELEHFIIKYCFYVPPNQLKSANKRPSKSVVARRTKARRNHQKLIDRNVKRRIEDKEPSIDAKHRPQIGDKGTVDRWIDAIYWWQEQINAQCVGRLSIDAVVELKPLETEGLTDDRGKPLDNFAKNEKLAKEKASWRWVIGQRDLDGRTRQGDTTRTHFHISLFKYVRVKSNKKTDGIIFGMSSDGKPPPFANYGAVLKKPMTYGEIHEVGHLFGLEHRDGGVMSKRAGSTGTQGGYGKGFAFDDAKCRKVIRQLKGS